ncbi:NRDE-2-like protein [Elsinoe australis]|uniref:NRDE-2-like protein n=1 Tax=Elsinoe australis TaxID=40998 RepID=A0A4U7ANB8_9PEZI|nr:NRDE-2-like protein [Elsinoe australis]
MSLPSPSSDRMSGEIPKFKSFQPKQKTDGAAPTPEPHRRSREHRQHDERKRDRTRSHRGHGSEARSSRNRDSYSEEERHDLKRSRGPGSAVTEDGDLFLVDRTGDLKNLTYGSLHKYSVPRYHRQGYGKILGLDTGYRIDRDASSTTEVLVERLASRKQSQSRRVFSKIPNNLYEHKWKFVRSNEDIPDPGDDRDFLLLAKPGNKKRKRGSELPDAEIVDYRSIEGKAKPATDERSNDSDLMSDASDNEDFDGEKYARQQNVALMKQTQKVPRDREGWEALIEHQSRLVRPDTDPENFTCTQRRTLADMRLGLYEKALQVLAEDDRETILEAMLTEGSKLWDAAAQARKWREALDSNPNMERLWIRYFDMVQTPVAEFKYEEVKKAYVEVLSRIDRLRNQHSVEPQRLMSVHIHGLLRLIRCICDTGYHELSIALFQGLVALHLRGSQDARSFASLFSELEQAWDDELPRFGEHDSASNVQDGTLDGLSQRHSYTALVRCERVLASRYEVPGKTSDDVDDTVADDALHVVFFSDLRDILASTSSGLDPSLLLDAFLSFFHLPPLPLCSSSTWLPWRSDPFLAQPPSADATLLSTGSRALDGMGATPQTLSSLWSKYRVLFPRCFETRPAVLGLIRNGLQEIVSSGGCHPYLSAYLAIFCLRYFSNVASKTAKKLIKARPTDPTLYTTAANIEFALGNTAKAINIWTSTIKSHQNTLQRIDKHGQDDLQEWRSKTAAVLLSHDWAWAEMRRGNEAEALRALLCFNPKTYSDDTKAQDRAIIDLPPATKLVVQQDLTAAFESALLRHEIDQAALFSSSLCLFTYLTSSQLLRAVFDTTISHLSAILNSSLARTQPKQTEILNEALHESKAAFITHHLDNHRSHRPAELMIDLTDSLTRFPSNPKLLAVYSRLTSNLNLLDLRLRNLDRPWLRLNEKTNIVNWTFGIKQEIERCDRGSATKASVRSLFNRALLIPGSQVAHCAALWHSWFAFEASTLRQMEISTSRPEQAKSSGKKEQIELQKQAQQLRMVFFDGLKEIPWNRDWILLGLEVFDSEGAARMSKPELRRLYSVLFQRDMRVRVEFEDDE